MMLENKAKIAPREINLIPLINIIFLLLTFFMVAGTMEKADPFLLNLPEASKNGAVKPQRTNVIYLNKDGRIIINDDFVSREDFATIINTLLLENKDKELIIKADADVSSKSLIWAMRAIESVGGSDISIITRVVK